MKLEKQIKINDLLESEGLEKGYFRRIQKFIYETSGLYAMSVDLDGNVLAPVGFIQEEEGEYIHSIFTEEVVMDAVDCIQNIFLEEIVQVPICETGAVCQAIVFKINERPAGVMLVLGFLEEETIDSVLPDGIRKIKREKFDGAVAILLRQITERLKSSERTYKAMIEAKKAKEAEARMEEDYVRSAIITDIVQMLESEEEVVDIITAILEKVGKYLNIDVGALYRINGDGESASIISEWTSRDEYRKMEEANLFRIVDNPFMRKENYIISSNTALNERQREYMNSLGYTAAMIFPIIMEQQVIMYLEFACKTEERIWKIETIRFLSDVRKIVQSIIIKRVTQNSLSSSLSTLEEMMEHIGSGIVVVQPDTREVLFFNHLLTEELICSLKKIDLRTIFYDEKDKTEFYVRDLQQWLLFHRAMIPWVDGTSVELYTFYDITKNKDNEKSIEKSSNCDFLTGLYNRMRCEQDLGMYIELAKNNGGKGAVLFFDLDDFKHINEGLGHQYGDILLKAVSANLRRIPGVESNCYRVGGDEFIVLVTNTQYEQLERIIQSIQEIFRHPWYLKGDEYYCTMSMGVCRFPQDGENADMAIRNADAALLEAKREGKNRVSFYDGSTQVTDLRRLDMEKYMRDACLSHQDEFEVYYQPIIDISKEENPCVGAEALVRWNSKGLGRVKPKEFVPLAEYLGLINPIGKHVLRKACEACKRWNDLGHPDYKVNVNFSVVQLLEKDMELTISEVLEETGLRPKNLTVEVTESLAVNDLTYMKKVLNKIRSLGVRVALDDFGTGYSSLNHIHEMPIDIIKVDRCFVQNIGQEEYSQVFVKMVSELAKVMGMNVCVEGVEDEKQFKMLKDNNINMVQGFYFAEPMPCEEFEMKFVD